MRMYQDKNIYNSHVHYFQVMSTHIFHIRTIPLHMVNNKSRWWRANKHHPRSKSGIRSPCWCSSLIHQTVVESQYRHAGRARDWFVQIGQRSVFEFRRENPLKSIDANCVCVYSWRTPQTISGWSNIYRLKCYLCKLILFSLNVYISRLETNFFFVVQWEFLKLGTI